MERKDIAHRFGPRLSNFLSYRIVVFIKIDDFRILCLLFSQYCLKSKTELPFEKTIPGLPRLEPHRKVNATTLYIFSQTFKTLRKTANLFPNLDFLPKSGFPKTLDLSMDFPWRLGSLGRALLCTISHDFSKFFWHFRGRSRIDLGALWDHPGPILARLG